MQRFSWAEARSAADTLRSIAAELGHLVHMPSHAFFREGAYHAASDANEEAIAADDAYFAAGPRGLNLKAEPCARAV